MEKLDFLKTLTYTESNGDVHYYKNKLTGRENQQLGSGEIFPIRNGKPSYKPVQKVGKLDIKYHNNGIHGFTIFRGKMPLEDNIWLFRDAERIAKEMQMKCK